MVYFEGSTHLLFLISKTTRITTSTSPSFASWSCLLLPKQQGLQLKRLFIFLFVSCFLFPKQQGLQLSSVNCFEKHVVSYFQNNKDYNISPILPSLTSLFLISKTTRITTTKQKDSKREWLFITSKTTRITTDHSDYVSRTKLFITSKTTRIQKKKKDIRFSYKKEVLNEYKKFFVSL